MGGSTDYRQTYSVSRYGVDSLYVSDEWHFQGGCCGIFINRYPRIDAYVKANGVTSGTVYYR